MQASRVVYGREFRVTPVWAWVLQRLSGVLLGPLVLAHVWWPQASAAPLVRALLLAALLIHGYTGLQRLIMARPRRGAMVALAAAWCAVVGAFGLLAVFLAAP